MDSMRIIEWKDFLNEGLLLGEKRSAVTVGVFDGIHRGHKALIDKIVHYDRKILPVIVTFRENHKNRKSAYPGDITSFRQKTAFFKDLGAAVTVVADLSDSFRRMTGADFLHLLRKQGSMAFCAVGSNFRCGYHLDTDAGMIQKLNAHEGIETDVVEALTEDGLPISSSRIRTALLQGKLEEAEAMLGHAFSLDLSGAVNCITGKSVTVPGRIYPQAGNYNVLLYDKNNVLIKQTRISISEGSIKVPGDEICEYIEFIP